MPDPSPYVPADIPKMLYHPDMSPWHGPIQRWSGGDQRWITDDWPGGYADCPVRLDTRRPEVRDHLSRVLARVMGVAVGLTAPSVAIHDGIFSIESGGLWHDFVGPHIEVPILTNEQRALALACVVRWVGEENRAGHIEVPK